MTESEHKVFMEERKARSNALKQALGISSLPLATRNAVESYLDGDETLEWAGVATKRPAMEERNRRRTALQAYFEGQNIAKFEPTSCKASTTKLGR